MSFCKSAQSFKSVVFQAFGSFLEKKRCSFSKTQPSLFSCEPYSLCTFFSLGKMNYLPLLSSPFFFAYKSWSSASIPRHLLIYLPTDIPISFGFVPSSFCLAGLDCGVPWAAGGCWGASGGFLPTEGDPLSDSPFNRWIKS